MLPRTQLGAKLQFFFPDTRTRFTAVVRIFSPRSFGSLYTWSTVPHSRLGGTARADCIRVGL